MCNKPEIATVWSTPCINDPTNFEYYLHITYSFFVVHAVFSYKQTIDITDVFHFKTSRLDLSFLPPVSFELIHCKFYQSDFLTYQLTKKSGSSLKFFIWLHHFSYNLVTHQDSFKAMKSIIFNFFFLPISFFLSLLHFFKIWANLENLYHKVLRREKINTSSKKPEQVNLWRWTRDSNRSSVIQK